MGNYEKLPPRANAMIASMRAMGYDLSMAIADLIDNSIYAQAKNIGIDYHWEGGDSWIRVTDDGTGMTETRLKEAMRLGSQSPKEERDPRDLGRFGLGLKTASFSQCKVLTVHTKPEDGKISTRCWDLDHVEKTKEWEISKVAPPRTDEILEKIEALDHGTIILWQGLDRVIDHSKMEDEGAMDEFNQKFFAVKDYLEMVFHRYLAQPSALKITVGVAELKPWDPYLRSNQFTQELASEKYEDGTIKIVGYVLPHISKRTKQETRIGAGQKGWNAQQGFYLYRNRRMIVPGGYLDFPLKPEEHYKLGRIRVDIPNQMDGEWRIDVRKSTAIPPDRLRGDLQKVAKATRIEAQKIYRARTGRARRGTSNNTQEVWLRKRDKEKIVYFINRENEVIKSILEEEDLSARWIAKLFHVIESTVPQRLIIMDNSKREDCHVNLPDDMMKPLEPLIELCREMYLIQRKTGKNHQEAVDIVTSIEPFNTHSRYRAELDKIEEEGVGDG